MVSSSSDEISQPSTSMRSCRTPIKKRKMRNELSVKEKSTYSQKFKREWLELPQFKNWLKENPKDSFSCRCTSCDKDLRCGKSELEKHGATEKHRNNYKKKQGLVPLSNFFEKTTIHSTNVATAEIKLSNFFAHHNVAFQIVEHLVPVLKECFPDSKILNDIKLGRNKTTKIIKNVIAEKETADLVVHLQKKCFSVLIDESTDISVNKLMCINVKFLDESNKICDRLLELVTVDAKSANAENIFNAFQSCLESKNIPMSNIIGFAADNAGVMMGRNNSFLTRLQGETRALIVLPCICHSSALVASHASSKLPRTPEEFIRNVVSYFSCSAKRTAELAEMQEFFHLEQKRMLKLASTRWLSMQHSIQRILDNWIVLQNYFLLAKAEENSKCVNFIFEELNNNTTKSILLFLSHILKFFNKFNAMFQGKYFLIHELSLQCKKLFRQVIAHFIKTDYLNEPKLNCKNPHHFLDLEDIDLGSSCNSLLLLLPPEIRILIRKSCLDFLITAATEMQQRFPMDDIFFDSLKFLSPEMALSLKKPEIISSLGNVWRKFSSIEGINGENIDRQWKNIAIDFSSDDEKKLLFQKMGIEEFWNTLGDFKDFNGDSEYNEVVNLARLCMVLPHSNAETERVFSVVTDVKTKKRNKLGSEALNAVSVIRFSGSAKCCQSFKVVPEHLNLMKYKNLYNIND